MGGLNNSETASAKNENTRTLYRAVSYSGYLQIFIILHFAFLVFIS